MQTQELARPAPEWALRRGLAPVLERWRGSRLWPCFVAEQLAPPNEARFADVPDGVAQPVLTALERRGIDRLFTHQAAALELARSACRRGDPDRLG